LKHMTKKPSTAETKSAQMPNAHNSAAVLMSDWRVGGAG
jgi:hypothetical protein